MSRKSHIEREQERRKTTHPFHSFSFLSCHVSKSIVNVDLHQKSFLTSPILLLVNSLQQIVINIIPVDIATFYYTFQWQTNHSFRYQFLLTYMLLCSVGLLANSPISAPRSSSFAQLLFTHSVTSPHDMEHHPSTCPC